MKLYLFSLAAGLLVGVIYHLIGVRSPVPPAVALIGLLGILLGEQIVPYARDLAFKAKQAGAMHSECTIDNPANEPGNDERPR
jgi:XapX domain-containing protein